MSWNLGDEAHRQLAAIAGLAALLFLVLLASFVRTVRQAGVGAPPGVDESTAPRQAEAAPAVTSGDDQALVAAPLSSPSPGGASAPGNPLPTTAGQDQSWSEYRSSDHGMSFIIPASWSSQVPAGAPQSSFGNEADLVFEDAATRARLAVSIWEAPPLGPFEEWVADAAAGSTPVDGRFPTNATVAGHDALVVWTQESPTHPAVYSAFLSDGQRHFRIAYSAADGGAGLSVFVRLLVSLSLDGEDTLDTIPPLPMPDGQYFPSQQP